MRFTSFGIALILVNVRAKPEEFHGPLSSLPAGYTPYAAVVSRIKKSDDKGTVHEGDVGVLAEPNKDPTTAGELPFIASFSGHPGIPMKDTDFSVQSASSMCSGQPPYPRIGSHAVCLSTGSQPYLWHCPWETSYFLTTIGGCDAVTIDCSDTDRITRILNKYSWIQQRTDSFGPEMHCGPCNAYAQACVAHQCHGGPHPGQVPVKPTRLYDSQMPLQGLANSQVSMMLAFVISIFAVAGFAFVLLRAVRAGTAHSELLHNELDAEAAILNVSE